VTDATEWLGLTAEEDLVVKVRLGLAQTSIAAEPNDIG